MRGDMVVVRDREGRPLVRRVWDETRHAVYIRSEEEYQKAVMGGAALEPVGFPWEAVFEYDLRHVQNAEQMESSKLSPRLRRAA